ncbi:hypothetical protein ACXN5S_19095 [Pseudoroseicyclus sp. H15]
MRFDTLLSEERQCILAGDFAALSDIGLRKAALFEELRHSADAAALRRIGTQLKRNQRLLAAAISGVREAERRVGLLHQAESDFSTYSENGTRNATGRRRPGLEKRA